MSFFNRIFLRLLPVFLALCISTQALARPAVPRNKVDGCGPVAATIALATVGGLGYVGYLTWLKFLQDMGNKHYS
jgi:hypothetical protein